MGKVQLVKMELVPFTFGMVSDQKYIDKKNGFNSEYFIYYLISFDKRKILFQLQRDPIELIDK